MRQNIQEWTCFNKLYHFKFFKGCISQILLGPFLNTLFHIKRSTCTEWIKTDRVYKKYLDVRSNPTGFQNLHCSGTSFCIIFCKKLWLTAKKILIVRKRLNFLQSWNETPSATWQLFKNLIFLLG